MTTLTICKNNNPVLRKKSQLLKMITDEEKELFESMLKTMYSTKGVGLAAPQIGVLKQMIVVNAGSGPLRLANPKIIKKKGETVMEEGCLSLPEIMVKIKRAKQIIVEALDQDGKKVRIAAEDLLSRVIQHEVDHLKGILIIDYLPWHKRIQIRRKLSQRGNLSG